MRLISNPARVSARRLFCTLLFSALAILQATSAATSVRAQDEDSLQDQERAVADRFLGILLKRPRPGTSLDRVYGFHVRNATLDEFIESLDVDDSSEDAGPRAMILGLLQLQRGKAALASEALRQAETRMPEDAVCSFYLGRALLSIGQTEQAAAAMERAIERGPARNEALPIFTELGRLYGRAGLNDKALSVWTRLEEMFPGDARVGGQIAQTLAEEGNVEEALKRYTALAGSARQEESRITFAVRAAEMKRRLGNTDEATQDLEKILAQLRPGSWLYTDVRNRIEDGFLKSGDFDALAGYYLKRLEQDADNLELRTRLGRILISAGRLDEAQETLQQAVERAPDDAEVRLALIDLLLNKSEIALAAKQFQHLAEQDPENPDYLLRWGQTLLDDAKTELDERRKNAAEIWQRLADARTDDAVTLAQVADRMRSIDQQDKAIEIYRQAIETDPGSPQYREYLGEYLHQLERSDEAVEVWESIAADDRRNRESLVRLAEVFATFEMPEKSVATWKEASEFDLTFAQELRFAEVLRTAEQFDEALQRLDAAERIAESPDERDQLLRDRITTYGAAGTLNEQIARLKEQPDSVEGQRQLAMMYQAAGQLTAAAEAIQSAVDAAPDNIPVLVVAADIAERQNRFADAVDLFRKLSATDTRYQTSYLKRVAGLQSRMGQIDDALRTCEELIEANPASTESYQFYARTALQTGRQDSAVEALRRAMNVARRDNGPRNMLAAFFADAYRTDEAIDLYWQSLEYESKPEERISVIQRLAPLYDRRNELERLVERIEELGRKDNDFRTTQLMISTAYETVQDYGAARQALDQLLAKQPRDVSLLERMVRLCDQANELELAADFQQRITALADTPENRYRLIQLRLDSGMIDVATALSERISLTTDPSRLGRMIRSAAMRQDTATAIAICEEALRSDSSLWDVRLMLAQLLLSEKGEDAEARHQQADAHAQQVIQADFDRDARPPTAAAPTSTPGHSGRQPNYSTLSPSSWGHFGYQLARNYQLGRYGNANYGYGNQGVTLLPIGSFQQGRVLAMSLRIVARVHDLSGDELTDAFDDAIEELAPLPPLDEVTNPDRIWEHLALESLAAQIVVRTSDGTPDPEKTAENERVSWRLAELDREHGVSRLYGLLRQRLTQTIAAKAQENESDSPDTDGKQLKLEPLSDEQLEMLTGVYEEERDELLSKPRPGSIPQLLNYQEVLKNELLLAGKPERAAEIETAVLPDDASFGDILGTITFYLQMDRADEADALVERLLPSIRRDTASSSGQTSRSSITGSLGSLARNPNDTTAEFLERHRLTLLDALIANCARSGSQFQRRGQSTLSDGTVRGYYRTSPNGGYRSLQLKGPLSTALFDQAAVSELNAVIPPEPIDGNSRTARVDVPRPVITHLATPLADAPPREQKTRRTLAAFAHWWADRPADCYQELIRLCEDFPDDVDLQIERARLASELGQTQVALEALDSFEPLDSNMLVRREMAAMNLASELGDVERARVAAERLFGMRMDSNTQLALADQLRRLGMKDRATAVLRRMRGGRQRDESTELQIASAFLAAGDREAAGEVAYSLLRRLNSGRGRQSGNVSYYRQQAVSTLQSAGRLDSLIERGERRLKAAPKSMRTRTELSDLYIAAGRPDDAAGLWEGIAGDQSGNARLLMSRADALSKAKKHKEAMEMYLDAFEKEPQLFQNDYYKMTQAAREAKAEELMFERLLKFPPDAIPYYRVDELLRMGDRSKFGETKRKFVVHVLKGSQHQQNFYRIIQSVPEAERGSIPELRAAMIDTACSRSAFEPTSSVWRVNSYSSGGKANGPLKEVIALLRTDDEARQKFDEAAAKALESEDQKPTSRLLTALLDVADQDLRPAAVATMRELTQPADGEESDEQKTTQISGGLLWQAGQILETTGGIEDRPSLLVAVYEKATVSPNMSRMDDIRYSVIMRLIGAYRKADQPEKARRRLLDSYHAIDNSEQNQYNPGYGDYRDLSGWKSIADQLLELKYPIDALSIYYRGMSNPAKFEKAKRWGGSQKLEDFEQGAESARKSITPQAAVAHLQLMVRESIDSDDPQAIRMQDLPLELIAAEGLQSGLALSISTAAKSDAERTAMTELADKLARAQEDRPDDWSIPATRLMIGAAAESADIAETAKAVLNRLPDAESIEADAGTPAALQHRPLLDLYTPVAFVLDTEHPQAQEASADLVAYLKTVAATVRDPNVDLALSSLTGDTNDSLVRFIESIEASVQPGSTLSESQFKTAMRVARSAASVGNMTLSARALTLALGNGPPLRKMGDTGDAFSINRNRRTSSRDQQDDGMSELTQQLLELIDAWTDATGYQLGARPPQTKPEEQIPAAEREAALSEVTSALAAAVLPDSRGNMVFPYTQPVAALSGYDRYGSDEKIVPRSASKALSRAAAACDRSDELIQAVQTRLELPTDRLPALGVLIDVAAAAGDTETLRTALNRLSSELGEDLPESSMVSQPLEQLRSINSQQQQDSYRKSEIINQVMHAAWLLAEDPETADEIAEAASTLLGRTVTLINSDSYTASRHRQISSWIQQQALSGAADRQDATLFGEIVGKILKVSEQQWARYSPSQQSRMRMNQMQTLLNRITKEGHIGYSHSLLRGMIKEARSAGWDYEALTPAVVCMAIAREPKEEQLTLLLKTALGESSDAPVRHGGGIVRYQIPPEVVRHQTPRWEDATRVPVCDPDFHVTDTLLMLADVAAELEKSENVAAELSARSSQPGDDADVAAALVRLAPLSSDPLAALEAIRPTLDAVAGQLEKSRPEDIDSDIEFPDLACYLVIRSIRAGLPYDGLPVMLDDCRRLVLYGNKKMMTSALSRFQMKQTKEPGPATSSSPLEHFVTVSVPNRYHPDTPTLTPLYAVDQDGWLHATGGYRKSMLMLRYPVVGSFSFSADVYDTIGSEASLSWGGIMYASRAYDSYAAVSAFGSGSGTTVEFPAAAVRSGEFNQETLQVTPEQITRLCNGEAWVTDSTFHSFPWIGLAQDLVRTTQTGNFQISGDATIPDEVNLIAPGMRGWAILTQGIGQPDPLLPVGPEQNADELREQREAYAEQLADDYIEAMWSVKEELRFTTSKTSRRREMDSHMEYLRPLLDGESVELSFWWETDSISLDLTLGRMRLGLRQSGIQPSWIQVVDDLATREFKPIDQSDDAEAPAADDKLLQEKAWNTARITRRGNSMEVVVNDRPLTTVAMDVGTRFGILRPAGHDVRIQTMTLTGNWPDRLPENLMERARLTTAGH